MALHQQTLEPRRQDHKLVHPSINPIAHSPHQPQRTRVVEHARGAQSVGPHVLDVIDKWRSSQPSNQAGSNTHSQRRVIRVHHIRSLGDEDSVKQRRSSKAGVIDHPLDGRLVMVRVQRQSSNLHAVNALTLNQLDLVARIHLSPWIVGETCHNLNVKP